MAGTISSPNMLLPVPTPSVESSPQWASDLSACFALIDQHNHAPGSGVQINPAGININTDLPINNNNLTGIRSVRLQAQASPLALASDLACLYSSGVDLYFNDGNGNQIKMTAGGSVNATSSGISSGTASASFSAGVLVVDSASNTPANIQGASILLGNNVANSKYLTLSPPAAMGSNFGLTLPSIPAQTSIMTIDTSGNMTGAYTLDGTTIAPSAGVIGVPAGGIGTTQIATGGVHTANIATGAITQGLLAVRATGSTVTAGGVGVSSSCGAFATSGSGVSVTNLSVTITTTGSPVFVGLMPDGTGSASSIFPTTGATGQWAFFFKRGSTTVSVSEIEAAANTQVPPSTLWFIDFPPAGTYTYTLVVTNLGGSGISIYYTVLTAYEL